MVIRVDDPRRAPPLQLPLLHIEVLEGLQVAELRYAGHVQEPRLPGQHVKEATQAAVKRDPFVRVQSKPTPTATAAYVLHEGGAEHEPTVFSVEATQSTIDLCGTARLPDRTPAVQEWRQVVGMDCSLPPVIASHVGPKTCEFAPVTVDEIAPTVALRCPDQCRERIHNPAEVDLSRRVLVTVHVHLSCTVERPQRRYLDVEASMFMLRLRREFFTNQRPEAMLDRPKPAIDN